MTRPGGRIAVAALLLLTLAACTEPGNAETRESSNRLTEQVIVLTDGRVITCVTYKAGYAGGLSCDWDGAK